MGKARGVEARLERLRASHKESEPARLAPELAKALADSSNLVVAESAAIVGEANLADLAPQLVAAFDRLMIDPVASDKLCRGKTAIALALNKIEYLRPEVFLRGIRHVQMEPVWGGEQDTAAHLRAHSAFGLVRLQHPDVLLLLTDLLVDEEKIAREAAAQALGASGRVAAIPLLRFKVYTGDEEPEVIAACFTSLIGLDPPASIPFVARFLQAGGAPQEAAVFALGESRRPEAFAPLRDFYDTLHPGELQEATLLAISLLRQPAAVDFLLEVVRHPDPATARAAISALAIHRHQQSILDRVAAAVRQTQAPDLQTWFERKFRRRE